MHSWANLRKTVSAALCQALPHCPGGTLKTLNRVCVGDPVPAAHHSRSIGWPASIATELALHTGCACLRGVCGERSKLCLSAQVSRVWDTKAG